MSSDLAKSSEPYSRPPAMVAEAVLKASSNSYCTSLQRVKCEYPELEAAEALLEMGCSTKILITQSPFYDKKYHRSTTATVDPTPNNRINCALSNGPSYVAVATNGSSSTSTTTTINTANVNPITKKRKLNGEINGTTQVRLNLDSSNTNAITTTKKLTTANGIYGVATNETLTIDQFENIENSMNDKLLTRSQEEVFQSDSRPTFAPRSSEEKRRMRNNLIEFLTDEDIRYLRDIHQRHINNTDSKYHMPFGSDAVNKSHLTVYNMESMIDYEDADERVNQHPKWWKGCSRCDIIAKDEEKIPVDEGMSFSELRDLIRSYKEQSAVMKGDQRILPPGPIIKKHEFVEFIKTFTLRSLERKYRRFKKGRRNKPVKNMITTTTTAEPVSTN